MKLPAREKELDEAVKSVLPEGWGYVLAAGKPGTNDTYLLSNIDEEHVPGLLLELVRRIQSSKSSPVSYIGEKP